MKEYVIYIRCGSGSPYFTNTFDSFDKALDRLHSIISLEEERNRPYYVDNDFFNNIYHQSEKFKYLCIKEREVEEWQKFSKNNFSNHNKKIIYLDNYKI